jgi:hypothetical protein
VYYAGVEGMKVYSAASASSKVVGTLSLHEKVTRTGLERGYAYVQSSKTGTKGWVDNAKLIWRLPAAPGAAAPAPEEPQPQEPSAPAPEEAQPEEPAAPAGEEPPAPEAPEATAAAAEPPPTATPVPAAPAKSAVTPGGVRPSIFNPY